MSEYFGLREDKLPRSSSFDRNMMPDGPMAANFENYVRNCFRVGSKLPSGLAEDGGVSASTMLRMEDSLGPSALDSTYDEEILKDPLERMYSEMGLSTFDGKSSRHFPVYAPKQSSEYFSTLYNKSQQQDTTPYAYRSSYKSDKELAEEKWRKNNKQMLIDYKDFDSPRLSPYMYQEHPYVRAQDSRIVCSNFVQITSRPRDNFLDKVDKLLADVRSTPRY